MLRLPTILIALLLVGSCSPLAFAGKVLKSTQQGDPQIKSINTLSFAPEGVLLIGDGRGAQIVAVQTNKQPSQSAAFQTLEGIDVKLAARVGAPAKGIEIIDMAVSPLTSVAYIAVRKQDDKSQIIFTVSPTGTIGLLDLSDVHYASVKLRSGDATVTLVTDVAWADSQIVAAARSSEAFASKIFSIQVPLSKESESKVFTAETYHVSHGRWETKAPMSVLIPIKENDQTFVVGAFSCTPVVKYRIDSLKPGATVKGSSMIELGSGNRPVDMFIYEKGGKPFVLANTFRFHHSRKPFGPSPYWTVKFQQGLLAGESAVNEKAVRRLKSGFQPATDRIEMVDSYHGVMQMDRLGKSQALAIQDTGKGLNLVALDLP